MQAAKTGDLTVETTEILMWNRHVQIQVNSLTYLHSILSRVRISFAALREDISMLKISISRNLMSKTFERFFSPKISAKPEPTCLLQIKDFHGKDGCTTTFLATSKITDAKPELALATKFTEDNGRSVGVEGN
jgi:hypothetical protein